MKNDNLEILNEIIFYIEAGARKKGKHDTAYCGVRKVPKGKKMGTLRECVEKGEVRLWGRLDYLKYRMQKLQRMLDTHMVRVRNALAGPEKALLLKQKINIEDEMKKVRKDISETEKHISATKDYVHGRK